MTEAITRQDLVELMLRVAAGQKLNVSQEEANCVHGWAMESRVYAEDPARGEGVWRGVKGLGSLVPWDARRHIMKFAANQLSQACIGTSSPIPPFMRFHPVSTTDTLTKTRAHFPPRPSFLNRLPALDGTPDALRTPPRGRCSCGYGGAGRVGDQHVLRPHDLQAHNPRC